MSTYNNVTPKSLSYSSGSTPAKVPQSPSLPDSLTTFVQDCHNKAAARNLSRDDFSIMQLQLRQLIERANLQGKIWINNWSQQTIPLFDANKPLDLVCNINNSQPKQKMKRALDNPSNADLMSSDSRKKLRANRFEKELKHSPSFSSSSEEFKGDVNQAIRGTSQILEKGYLRLTSAPDPSKVRPLMVLQRAFNLIFDKYKDGAPYSYICDQFKSMRQDLRVQLIENEFTVKVYETHARIALENKDLGEFNQCQTVLKNLYQSSSIISSNQTAFLSYRILYHVFTRNYDVIVLIKSKLTDKEKQDPLIEHSLNVLKAQLSNNYFRLFQLYSSAKGTSRNLMDCFITNERVKALAIICSSYKILNMEFLLSEFRFSNEKDCMNFISELKLDQFIELRGENVYLNTANARGIVHQISSSKSKIDIKGQI